MMSIGCIGSSLLLASAAILLPPTLSLPPRPEGALTGTEVTAALAPLSLKKREAFIYAQIAEGNVPGFLRQLVPVTVLEEAGRAIYFVTPDYLALGSEEDYFLSPITAPLAQQIADLLDCTLPTRRMVDQIWDQAPVKLSPAPIPPSPAMTTIPVFAEHNARIRRQRNAVAEEYPPGTLVAGSKKDVVLSLRIHGPFARSGITRPVVIYGWQKLDGKPIQPLYNGHHQTYVDYSHGIRLVHNAMTLDGAPTRVADVLADPVVAPLLSDEGPLPCLRYPRE
jgi:hypothetical protein